MGERVPEKDTAKGDFIMKKLLVALTLMLTLLATCLVGCGTVDEDSVDLATKKANAAAVFTLDVNPGVRIYVEEDSSVIAVEATNEDGEEIVAELDLADKNYEAIVEEIIDKMDEQGYLEGEENSVLISVEKTAMDISEKLNEKINKTFEKHGKKASVIEQDLHELDEKVGKTIGDMAKKYHISEGKAHLIEKIREEYPELSEEELAGLKVNDLGMMLEETSDDIKGHFKKFDKPVDGDYIGKEVALTAALESLEITAEDVTAQHVHFTRDDGKMIYEVEFIYDGMEYEIDVDATTGEILETESEEFEEFDAKGFIDDFCDKNEIGMDGFKDHGKKDPDGKDDHSDKRDEEKILSRGEILESVISMLGIDEDTLKKTDVTLHETESGTIFFVKIETKTRDRYEIVVEAYSGTILKAELNRAAIEISTEVTD